MIQLVIGLNVAIALMGFVLAWRLWRLKQTLTSATVALDSLEQEARGALSPDQAPAQLAEGRDAIVLARTRYRRLRQQLQQLQQIFGTVVVVLRWVRRVRFQPRQIENQ
ncbi:hypothetical protein [Leptolyngbya iicbica]|uniref:Uncharacterized protein n=2 Tax=Cyanophyceae TaxID=3028117 RepID=A0A4Q7E9G3_9CYAN|nr:hypothetical protein [Leptolyngbya sp. LK]RZM79181.1 hypothetical protein DYY88_10515 [Leptolyngbya sp. LK]